MNKRTANKWLRLREMRQVEHTTPELTRLDRAKKTKTKHYEVDTKRAEIRARAKGDHIGPEPEYIPTPEPARNYQCTKTGPLTDTPPKALLWCDVVRASDSDIRRGQPKGAAIR